MSYIEKKYRAKITEIFESLSNLDKDVLEQLNKRTISNVDMIARLCAACNKQINEILKKYYPEIKEINDKLQIKSELKFYFDLIDYLTDFVKNVETFQKLDEKYYDNLIKFIQEKDTLISGKYKQICSQELTAFYDKQTRDNLEKILAEKIERKNREFFTIGPLEQELKKIAQIAGAKSISITTPRESDKYLLKTVKSVIEYSHGIDEAKAENVGREIKNFLESKKFKVLRHSGFILTDANLLLDKG
ncbi:MAG: hypothetical protein ACFFDX_15850 [Candidatus Odinarchaeota archaeon]